ncbi:hypothetical protein [Streptomyces sp. SAS_270]|uniref:hypothetical protein n=1 Tax=Streptomyces sp. SAS_270 TaxID=3412748 RepID=UPI00403C0FCE
MHPLKRELEIRGLSPAKFARKIARVHAEISPGSGVLGDGRAKVYRWLNGEATPEWAAQLAIAHFLDIDDSLLERYRWPDWLHLAAGTDPVSDGLWTGAGVLTELMRTTTVEQQPRRYPGVTGQELRHLLGTVAKALREQSAATRRREVDDIDLCRIKGIEERTSAGKNPGLVPALTAQLKAAQEEYSHSLELLARYGYGSGSPLGMQMLQLVARTAHLCGWLSYCIGADGSAQYYALAALRASAAERRPATVAFYLANMAAVHLSGHGEAKDAHAVIDVARSLSGDESPRLVGLLDVGEALAHAHLGRIGDSERAFDRAVAACGNAPTDIDLTISPGLEHLGEDWLPQARVASRLHLRQPSNALSQFAPLHRDFHQLTPSAKLRPETARLGLTVVHTHLACKDLDAAIAAGHQLFTLLATPPPELAYLYSKLFTGSAYRTERSVRTLLDRLKDPRAHG